jgi:hypothetical protein
LEGENKDMREKARLNGELTLKVETLTKDYLKVKTENESVSDLLS